MNPDINVGFVVLGFAMKAVLIVGAIVFGAGIIGGYTASAVTRRIPRTRTPIFGALFGVACSALWTWIILGTVAHSAYESIAGVYFPLAIPAVVIGALFGAFFISRDI